MFSGGISGYLICIQNAAVMKKVDYPILEVSDRVAWHDWLILHHDAKL